MHHTTAIQRGKCICLQNFQYAVVVVVVVPFPAKRWDVDGDDGDDVELDVLGFR